jgi:general secretion pathway protein K
VTSPRPLRWSPDDRGFALIAVLLVLAFVGVIGAEFAYSMRLEATAARGYKEALIAAHLAEAGFEQAIRELAAEFQYVGRGNDKDKDADSDLDCPLVFYSRERLAIKRLPHRNVPLGAGHFSYCMTDEEARLNLNTSPPDRVARLLEALGLERQDRDIVVDSLQDWKDANELHRANGAESEDTYLKRPVPYRSKNANLDSLAELIQIRGITAKLLEGEDGRPGLAALTTVVKGSGLVNINTVGKEVAKALGLSEAEFTEIEQFRQVAPYTSVGRFSGRGLNVTSRTFRIEALGLIDGQVRARLTAIVRKRSEAGPGGGAGTGASPVTVLEWSGVH